MAIMRRVLIFTDYIYELLVSKNSLYKITILRFFFYILSEGQTRKIQKFSTFKQQ